MDHADYNPTLKASISCTRLWNLLKTKSWDPQGNSRCKLGEEHIEGVEDGFMALRFRILDFKIIHDVGKHGPEHIGKHTPWIKCTKCGSAHTARQLSGTYHGRRKAAATLTPAAKDTTYVTIRLLGTKTTETRKGTTDCKENINHQ